MKKVLLSVCIIVLVILSTGCGATEEADCSDFAVTLKMPQEEIEVGKEFTVLIRFVNLTDKTYPIVHSGNENKSSMLGVVCMRDGDDDKFYGIISNAVKGHKIKAKEVIGKTKTITIRENGTYHIYAYAYFSIDGKQFDIKSNTIDITV